MSRAIGEPAARVCVFGQRWGPEPDSPDQVFGFRPGNGVHDVHMNQGNDRRHAGDDGPWQDGARLPDRWVGIFLAFQSQCWHTDERTGYCTEEQQPPTARVAGLFRQGYGRSRWSG